MSGCAGEDLTALTRTGRNVTPRRHRNLAELHRAQTSDIVASSVVTSTIGRFVDADSDVRRFDEG